MIVASITGALADFATHVVGTIGLPGIFALMVAESACVPIPSEVTMLFAGFYVATGHWSLWAITLAGVLGNLLGSWIAYAVGYFGRAELLEPRLHVSTRHVAWADRWFARYGAPAVFFARLLPGVRTFISLPAGAARMPFWRFSALTLAGCVPWVLALGLIGQHVGHDWPAWREHLHYLDVAGIALLILALAWIAIQLTRVRLRARTEHV